MDLTVNGEPFELKQGKTIADLLVALGLSGPVAVERNQEVIPRAQHATFELTSGDRLEIVHFVGGG